MRGLFARMPIVPLMAGSVVMFVLAFGWAAPCLAQFTGSTGGNGTGTVSNLGPSAQRVLRGDAAIRKPAEVAPPVLPGTKKSPEAAAPTASPADMSPTEALFDAINRGDLTAARDAVNRGADMQGQNVLGLTPLELSVDLGRNDISFMLLSMRSDDAASRASARRGTNQTIADQQTAAAAPRISNRSRATAVSARTVEEQAAASPRFFSRDGGTPIPAAGFLGFDERRVVH
jgi:hypothetical protein